MPSLACSMFWDANAFQNRLRAQIFIETAKSIWTLRLEYREKEQPKFLCRRSENMSDPAANKFASVRDGFAAIREIILVIALLALLFTPTTVREILQDAGIRSFAGVEFDEETLVEVENAGDRVAELEKQLLAAQTQLETIANLNTNRADPRLGTVSRLLADAQRSASEMGESLDEAKEKQIELWNRSGKPPRRYGGQPHSTSASPAVEQAMISPETLFQR